MSGKDTDFQDRTVFSVKGISHVEVVKSLSSHTNGLHTKGVTARIDIGCLFCIAAGNHTACSVFPFFGCVQEDINLLK